MRNEGNLVSEKNTVGCSRRRMDGVHWKLIEGTLRPETQWEEWTKLGKNLSYQGYETQ
jgi:hypothetical protein